MQTRSRWLLATGLLAAACGAHAQEALLEGSGFYGFDTGGPNPTLLNVVRLSQYDIAASYRDPARQFQTEGRVSAGAGQLGVALFPDNLGYDFQIKSRAFFSDVLTFSTAGLVTLRTQVHGEAFSLGADALGSVRLGIEMGTADGQRSGAAILSFSTAPGGATVTQLRCPSVFTCGALPAAGLPSFDLSFAFNVLANTPYGFSSDLQAVGRNNMAILFNNTATMDFDLAPGMSMSSGSGVFLSAVPEPSGWVLLAGGLGLLAGSGATRRVAGRQAGSGGRRASSSAARVSQAAAT